MNKDKYGEIINGEKTYRTVASKLKNGKSVIIGWTDEEYTHFDILFTAGAYKNKDNYLQRGLRGAELFVSIIGKGAFGFEPRTLKDRDYVSEKLNFNGHPTTYKFTELVNGVIRELNYGGIYDKNNR